MKEINIAKILVNKRREKGITQDELAAYIGVSKASVSKWETGQSYPDITFLPQLATYFNISIDDLLCYEPQMTKEDIRKLYHKLSKDFSVKPFNEVMNNIREIIKKYYSCFLLLIQMGVLIINYSVPLSDEKEKAALLEEARLLFTKVKTEGEDIELSKQALCMEGLCYITLGRPSEAIEALEGLTKTPQISVEGIIASAYQMIGKITEAKSILQTGLYQNIATSLGALSSSLMLYVDDSERFEDILKRGMLISEAFNLESLYPSLLMNLYLSASSGFMMQGNEEKAIEMLEKYTYLVTSNIYPLKLHGDGFFDLIDDFLNELSLGIEAPRNEKEIKKSIEEAVSKNPMFSPLESNLRFKRITEKLRNNC